MSIRGPVRLCVQYLTAVTALLIAFRVGVLSGSLAPLLRLDGWGEPLLIPVLAVVYLLVLASFATIALIVRDPPGVSETAIWERVTARSLAGTALGAIVGGGLVFGVPDWLSTTLPLVALSAATVALVLAGDAVPVRGLDTTLWSAAGTILLFVVPVGLSVLFGGMGLLVAVPVAIIALLVFRGWLGTNAAIDRRTSVSLALVFALVAGGVIAHDLSGPRPTVSLDHESTVTLSEVTMRTYSYSDVGEERATISVGTLRVRNEFDFSRTSDLPSFDACLYGADGTELKTTFALASVAEGDDWIRSEAEVRLPGESRHRYPVFVLFEDRVSRVPAEIRDLGPVPVRRAESCPEITDGPALVLVSASERGH